MAVDAFICADVLRTSARTMVSASVFSACYAPVLALACALCAVVVLASIGYL